MPHESKRHFGSAVGDALEAFGRLTMLNPIKNLPLLFLLLFVFVGDGFIARGTTMAINSFVPLSEDGQMYTGLAVFIFAPVLIGVMGNWLWNRLEDRA
jgi:hypothetical protein